MAVPHLVLRHGLLEGVIVSRVVGQLALREPDDVRAHTVEEVLTVCVDRQTDSGNAARLSTHQQQPRPPQQKDAG